MKMMSFGPQPCPRSTAFESLCASRTAIELGVVVALMMVGCSIQRAKADSPEANDAWAALPAILSQINPPSFPARDFNVADFGAQAEGQADCKPAFDKAIAKCAELGGGRVVVAEGRWLVNGPLHLKSNVCLHLHPLQQ
jgi:Pectate lyase superfamily protein